jgi:hypothetical protein
MDPAVLVKQSLEKRIAEGFVQVDQTLVYQVIADNRTDDGEIILGAEGLPILGQNKYIGQELVWVQRISPQPQGEPVSSKWLVTVYYSNARKTGSGSSGGGGQPADDLTQTVKEVDVTYQEIQTPVTKAKLDGLYQRQKGEDIKFTPLAFWLDSQAQDYNSSITNSALVPQEVFQIDFRKVVTVSKYYSQWDNTWDDYLGTVNDADVTITQSDNTGVRFQQTYAPNTLLMQDIIKEDVWRGPRLYFRVRFVMSYRKDTWRHRQADTGTSRLVFVGQYKPDGTQYDQGDLDNLNIQGEYGYQDITTPDGNGNFVAITQPVSLNGWGTDQPTNQNRNYNKRLPLFLIYDIYQQSDFNALNL